MRDSGATGDHLAKGGILLGNGMTGFAGLMTLVVFVLPWASCGGVTLNGADLARNTGVLGYSLFLIPLAALWAIALGGLGILLTLLGKSFRALALLAGLVLPACIVTWLVYFILGVRLLLENQAPIRFEYGFFLSGLSQAAMTFGDLLALIAALKGARSGSVRT